MTVHKEEGHRRTDRSENLNSNVNVEVKDILLKSEGGFLNIFERSPWLFSKLTGCTEPLDPSMTKSL